MKTIKGTKGANRLIGYMEIHKETPRALVLVDDILKICYLAGLDLSEVSRDTLDQRNFTCLHEYNTDEILRLAKERLTKGLIRENWEDDFYTFFKNKDSGNILSFLKE